VRSAGRGGKKEKKRKKKKERKREKQKKKKKKKKEKENRTHRGTRLCACSPCFFFVFCFFFFSYLVSPPPLSLSSSQEGDGRSFSRPVAPPNSYYPVYRTPLTSPGIGDVTLVDDGRRECFNGLVAVTRSEARSLGCKHLFGSRTSDRESYGESR